jgi:DNA-binding transcriptional LysR family regulator
VQSGLDSIEEAIADIKVNAGQPAGVLKLSAEPGFGMDFLLPLMPAFLERYPGVTPDWVSDIGDGFDLPPGMVARELARVLLIAVAAPALLQGKRRPKDPAGLADFPAVVMRSPLTGRMRTQVMRNSAGVEVTAKQRAVMLANDPDALSRAGELSLGVGLIPVAHAALHLESGALVRLLPNWYGNVGPISLYFTSQKLLPGKTRAFVDFVVEPFRAQKLPQLLSAKQRPSAETLTSPCCRQTLRAAATSV